jgi:hypothetical protein
MVIGKIHLYRLSRMTGRSSSLTDIACSVRDLLGLFCDMTDAQSSVSWPHKLRSVKRSIGIFT